MFCIYCLVRNIKAAFVVKIENDNYDRHILYCLFVFKDDCQYREVVNAHTVSVDVAKGY